MYSLVFTITPSYTDCFLINSAAFSTSFPSLFQSFVNSMFSASSTFSCFLFMMRSTTIPAWLKCFTTFTKSSPSFGAYRYVCLPSIFNAFSTSSTNPRFTPSTPSTNTAVIAFCPFMAALTFLSTLPS